MAVTTRGRVRGMQRWLAVLAGGVLAGSAPGQVLFDFETDLEGWAEVTFPEEGQVVSAAQSTAAASTGSGSMAVTKTPDEFSWTVQVSATNGLFHTAVSDALEDADNTYELVFDMIFRAVDLPGAGGTNTTFCNSLVAMSSDVATNAAGETVTGGWNQTQDAFGLGGVDIQALTDTQTLEVRVPLSTFNLTPGSSYYEMTLSLNGNYGSNASATVYYDNFRLELFSPIFFDFSGGLDGWMADELCGDVGLAAGVPAGDQSLRLIYTDFGPCRAGQVTKGPGDGHPMYRLIRDAVRDNPSNYTLDFDLILLASDLPGGATFLNPYVTFNADDGMSFDSQILADFQVDLASITADTIIPMQIPLDTWLWPADANWEPTFIQLLLGTEVDNGGNYSFYFDNFAIRPIVVEPPPPIFITGLDLQLDGSLSLSWSSVTDAVYSVSMATDPTAGDWTVIASNLLAEPPANILADLLPTEALGLFRVERSLGGIVVPLFDFETGLDDWMVFGGNANTSITNAPEQATSGDYSLAVSQLGDGFRWNVQWNSDNPSNTTFMAISNALAEDPRAWYFAFDVTYTPTNTPDANFAQLFVAFNGDAGWTQFDNQVNLNGAQIDNLRASTNNLVFTLSYSLFESGWDPASTYFQVNLGFNGDWGAQEPMTVFFDHFRLTTLKP